MRSTARDEEGARVLISALLRLLELSRCAFPQHGAVCNRTEVGVNSCGYKPHLQSTEQDVILSIEADGTEPVYDLTVPGNHNFVANDIIVHNSIEQDADVVLFIYREDYYIEDTDRQNIADILVTKHRHGATGTVSLYFRKELTQFRDLEIQRTELDY